MFNLKKSKIIKGLVGCMAIGLVSWLPGTASATVSGPCSDCHTMHNSQGGASMAYGINGTYNGTAADSTPNGALTKSDCIGCHSGSDSLKGTNSEIPVVLQYTEPDAQGPGYTLAGGDFSWVISNDAKGHNVAGIVSKDATLSGDPPGWNATVGAYNGIGTDWSSNQLTCAGTYGCHGDHSQSSDYAAVRGAHHASGSIDGSTVGTSYRFLIGIKGGEDSDWEDTATSGTTDHNQYHGVDGTSDNSTISYLCAECHGNFHAASTMSNISTNSTDGGSPWLRHPTDFALSSASGTGYTSYPNDGSTNHPYSIVAPVARDVSANGTAVSTVTFSGDDIVTCISCHRAHGTNQADLLRWSYSACEAGTPNSDCGCFACHTNKD